MRLLHAAEVLSEMYFFMIIFRHCLREYRICWTDFYTLGQILLSFIKVGFLSNVISTYGR